MTQMLEEFEARRGSLSLAARRSPQKRVRALRAWRVRRAPSANMVAITVVVVAVNLQTEICLRNIYSGEASLKTQQADEKKAAADYEAMLLYGIILHIILHYIIILYYVVECYTILTYIKLHHIILYYVILYYVTLYYITLYCTNYIMTYYMYYIIL